MRQLAFIVLLGALSAGCPVPPVVTMSTTPSGPMCTGEKFELSYSFKNVDRVFIRNKDQVLLREHGEERGAYTLELDVLPENATLHISGCKAGTCKRAQVHPILIMDGVDRWLPQTGYPIVLPQREEIPRPSRGGSHGRIRVCNRMEISHLSNAVDPEVEG